MGEILLSLSYLPTAERLTVVVVKAKNLIWTGDKTTAGEAPLAACSSGELLGPGVRLLGPGHLGTSVGTGPSARLPAPGSG